MEKEQIFDKLKEWEVKGYLESFDHDRDIVYPEFPKVFKFVLTKSICYGEFIRLLEQKINVLMDGTSDTLLVGEIYYDEVKEIMLVSKTNIIM